MDRCPLPRRAFLATLASGAMLACRNGMAQAAPGLRRIGVLANHVPRAHLEMGASSPADGHAAFVRALERLGWVEGRTIAFVLRSAEGEMARHPALASELVRLGVDVIVGGDDAMEACARATRTIPIVAYSMYRPVENGFARSLQRPGGNVTGIAASAGTELFKAMALAKEAVPRARRFALVAQASESYQDRYRPLSPALESALRELGVEGFFLPFGDPRTLPQVVESAVRQGADVMVVDTNWAIHYHRDVRERLALDAARHRLPVMHLALVGAEQGGLMAHGFDLTARWQRAAHFVHRILSGERAGDIPIEHPASPELHLNLRAARAIGLEFPKSVLLQASRVFD